MIRCFGFEGWDYVASVHAGNSLVGVMGNLVNLSSWDIVLNFLYLRHVDDLTIRDCFGVR